MSQTATLRSLDAGSLLWANHQHFSFKALALRPPGASTPEQLLHDNRNDRQNF
jgi:hypothetical protein